jgi:hypothetical protein
MNKLSDIALLVQRNEDNYNECKVENERLKLKINRLLRKISILKKTIATNNQGKPQSHVPPGPRTFG